MNLLKHEGQHGVAVILFVDEGSWRADVDTYNADYSKWHTQTLETNTLEKVIALTRSMFTRFGIPEYNRKGLIIERGQVRNATNILST